MINPTERKQLREALSQLFDGHLAWTEFAAVRAECMRSDDLGVAEIAAFADCFAGDFRIPREAYGIDSLDEESASIARRCLSFLDSKAEYRSPRRLTQSAGMSWLMPFLILLLMFPGCTVGMLSSFMTFHGLSRSRGDWPVFLIIAIVAFLPSLVIGVVYRNARRRNAAKAEADYWQHGDQTAWPFASNTEVPA